MYLLIQLNTVNYVFEGKGRLICVGILLINFFFLIARHNKQIRVYITIIQKIVLKKKKKNEIIICKPFYCEYI